MNFFVSFKPKEFKSYKTSAYLEVEGLQERIRFTMEGDAMGPNIAFNVSSIDFGKIFMCSSHTYAVIK